MKLADVFELGCNDLVVMDKIVPSSSTTIRGLVPTSNMY